MAITPEEQQEALNIPFYNHTKWNDAARQFWPIKTTSVEMQSAILQK